MKNIDELNIGEAKQLASLFTNQQHHCENPFELGEPYLIRTVTHILTGRVKRVTEKEIILTEAAWIADTGRFADQFKKSGEDAFDEVEPFPQHNEVIVGRGALIDATKLTQLPCSQK